ncbi:MAG: hypothetical protein M1526_06535 [Candidatus Thermoplasmatota archaeon]|nr:hypothetical protein [Candidatus Thermoplasmatota archaeon]
MLFFSVHKLIEWLPFLFLGLLVYYIAVVLYRNYKRNFSVPSSIYFEIAEIVVPMNLLVIVSLDLYFLFKGSSIFLMNPSTSILATGFTFLSFIVSFTSFSTVNSLYLRSSERQSKILLDAIIGSVASLLILTFLVARRVLTIDSVAPLLGFFSAPLFALTVGRRKFNPYTAMSVSFLIIAFSIGYLFFVFTKYFI